MLRICRLLLVFGLALAAPVAAARASSTQEASFQDNRLTLSDPAHLDLTLRTLRLLGVDRLRISVLWDRIAPDSSSRSEPQGFDAANPTDYPAANWAPYDTIAAQAAKYGLGVNFDLMGGAPLWAVGRAPTPSMRNVWYPSAPAFAAFAAAVGTRYSGRYTPPGASTRLPRVNYWSIWNEPNVGSSSLSPQTVGGVDVASRLYRALADAAYGSLVRTGHGPATDTILVGELASTGHLDPGFALGMQPLRFLRALYCVDSSYRPLRGEAAAARGCPTGAAGAQSFRSDNPVLFNATGWSHHPYDLTMAPNLPPPPAEPDWVTFANLSKLEGALDRIQLVYGSHKKFPIYLTEYGFETNPPRSNFAISPALQAVYLNEGEYTAWRDPRVQALSQYLLQDAPPTNGSSASSFATGLIFLNGTKKPSFAAYRLPLWMPTVKANRGDSLEVWGAVRPAKLYPRVKVGPVDVQLDRQTVRSVTVTNPRGYLDVHIAFAHSGSVRLAWRYPGGPMVYSRDVAVTETAGSANPAVLVAALGAGLVMAIMAGSVLVLHRRRAPAAKAG